MCGFLVGGSEAGSGGWDVEAVAPETDRLAASAAAALTAAAAAKPSLESSMQAGYGKAGFFTRFILPGGECLMATAPSLASCFAPLVSRTA